MDLEIYDEVELHLSSSTSRGNEWCAYLSVDIVPPLPRLGEKTDMKIITVTRLIGQSPAPDWRSNGKPVNIDEFLEQSWSHRYEPLAFSMAVGEILITMDKLVTAGNEIFELDSTEREPYIQKLNTFTRWIKA